MMTEGDAPPGAETTPAGNGGGADKTFTQAELDRIVGERVGRERQKYEGVDLDDLKTKAQKLAELEAAQQTDAEKLAAERDQHKTVAEKTAAENLRLRVAMEKQLPADLIDRMHGTTKEELEADADKLLELVSPTPGLDGGTRQSTNEQDMNALLRQAAGRT